TTTTTTTTTMPECTVTADCADQGPCTDKHCISGACSYTNKDPSTPVSNDVPYDCLQKECDGQGNAVDVPDDTETPPQDGAECYDVICDAGNAVPSPKNEGGPCSGMSPGDCQEAVCQGGSCTLVNFADGTIPWGACGTKTCQDGQVVVSFLDDSACPDG